MTRPKLSAREAMAQALVDAFPVTLGFRQPELLSLDAIAIQNHLSRLGYRIVPKPKKAGRGKGR